MLRLCDDAWCFGAMSMLAVKCKAARRGMQMVSPRETFWGVTPSKFLPFGWIWSVCVRMKASSAKITVRG